MPETSKGPRGQGGPASNEPRAILNGILWILRAGAPWKDMPERYSPIKPA
ncbi:transposase [uncultured Desulfovibrio sp.]